MAYVDLNALLNPSPGDPLPAAYLDQVRDNFEAIRRPNACKASRGTAQTLSENAGTPIDLTTTNFGPSMHSNSSDPNQINVLTAGFYVVVGNLVWETETAGYRETIIRQNGADDLARVKFDAEGSSATYQNVVAVNFADAGDYFELLGDFNASGSPTDLDVIGADLTVIFLGAV